VSHLESGFANAPVPRSSGRSHSLTGWAREEELSGQVWMFSFIAVECIEIWALGQEGRGMVRGIRFAPKMQDHSPDCLSMLEPRRARRTRRKTRICFQGRSWGLSPVIICNDTLHFERIVPFRIRRSVTFLYLKMRDVKF